VGVRKLTKLVLRIVDRGWTPLVIVARLVVSGKTDLEEQQ
jgi:hypothetical protein